MTAILADRRRSQRIKLELPVVLENTTAVTRDVSSSGVFFWKRGVFAYGESIRFSIERTTDSGRILQKCRGAVVRTEPRGDDVGVGVSILESATESVPTPPNAPVALTAPPGRSPDAVQRDEVPVSVDEAVKGPPVLLGAKAPETRKELPKQVEAHGDDAGSAAGVAESATESALRQANEPVPLEAPSVPSPAAVRRDNVPISFNEAVKRAPVMFLPRALEAHQERQEPAKAQGDEAGSAASIIESAIGLLPSQPNGPTPLEPPSVPSPHIVQQNDDVPAAVKETIKRWTLELRAMALGAREELQGQEVLEWDIPSPAGTEMPPSRRVTLCSVTVAGPASNVARVLMHNGMDGESLQAWYRLTSNVRVEAGKSASEPGVGGRTDVGSGPEPHDECGLRIELEIDIALASAGDGTPRKTAVPKILIRMAPVPGGGQPQERGNTRCPPKLYDDPKEAFEAFLALAVESAILMNLDSL